MSPTLWDVQWMLRLPFWEEELPSLKDSTKENLDINYSRWYRRFGVFINSNVNKSSAATNFEHAAFLTYQYNRHFVRTSTKAIVGEFTSIISFIMFGKQIALVPYFLAMLYHSLFGMITKLNTCQNVGGVGSPFWFLQLYIARYFLELSASTEESIEAAQEDSKEAYFVSFLKSYPFCPQGHSRIYSRSFAAHLANFRTKRQVIMNSQRPNTTFDRQKETLGWGSFLLARNLLYGIKPSSKSNKPTVEAYMPQCFTRQFLLYQNIPMSFATFTIADLQFG